MAELKARSSRFTLVLPMAVWTNRPFNEFHVIIRFEMCIQGVSRDSGVNLSHADIYIPCQCHLFTCGLYLGCLFMQSVVIYPYVNLFIKNLT